MHNSKEYKSEIIKMSVAKISIIMTTQSLMERYHKWITFENLGLNTFAPFFYKHLWQSETVIFLQNYYISISFTI